MREFFICWKMALRSDDKCIKDHAWSLLISWISFVISILCSISVLIFKW